MGRETPPDIGCLAGGGFVVAWRQTCSAIERRGIVEVVFRPDECDFGPPATRVAAPAESIPANPSVAALADGGEKVLVKTGHTG